MRNTQVPYRTRGQYTILHTNTSHKKVSILVLPRPAGFQYTATFLGASSCSLGYTVVCCAFCSLAFAACSRWPLWLFRLDLLLLGLALVFGSTVCCCCCCCCCALRLFVNRALRLLLLRASRLSTHCGLRLCPGSSPHSRCALRLFSNRALRLPLFALVVLCACFPTLLCACCCLVNRALRCGTRG